MSTLLIECYFKSIVIFSQSEWRTINSKWKLFVWMKHILLLVLYHLTLVDKYGSRGFAYIFTEAWLKHADLVLHEHHYDDVPIRILTEETNAVISRFRKNTIEARGLNPYDRILYCIFVTTKRHNIFDQARDIIPQAWESLLAGCSARQQKRMLKKLYIQ